MASQTAGIGVSNGREVLISLYDKTLKQIGAIPKDEGYLKAVEEFTRDRLKVCQEEDDCAKIGKRLGYRQVEALIEEAENELKLVETLSKNVGFSSNSEEEKIRLIWVRECNRDVPFYQPGPLPKEFEKMLEEVGLRNLPKPLLIKLRTIGMGLNLVKLKNPHVGYVDEDGEVGEGEYMRYMKVKMVKVLRVFA
ncbi:probable NADH dehydrogenase [ubiquinone] 1 alpha subcomplex subunit 5, mitochondrial [Rutidosis leptorrhynchoides]|uniref:probable NADH dehydrogenase [ubiquinone] 1 alpha subcomplex subunit 5, mitochondrial n=1 Tax=Rutidosis leptorrhynchoides TaxID=125765 RepID=UPI003A9954ED